MPPISVTGSERGFTLLELMVVIAILVMIATVFPMALDRALPGHRVSTTAEQLVSLIREAQDSSLFYGRPVALTLQSHGLVTEDASTLAPLRRAVLFPTSTDVRLADLEGRPVPAFVVYPDGSAQAVRFEVEDSGHRGTVMVSAVTGRVSIASGQ